MSPTIKEGTALKSASFKFILHVKHRTPIPLMSKFQGESLKQLMHEHHHRFFFAVNSYFCVIALIFGFFIQSSSYGLVLLPETAPNDPTTSTVIFDDPYTGMVLRTENRTVGTVAVSFPILTLDPQNHLYAQTGVESTLRLEGISFSPETLDLRVGLNWVHIFDEHFSLSLGISHESGHVMDNVIETELIPYNIGVDGFPIRLIYKPFANVEIGLHELVVIDAIPRSRELIGGLFFEYYPWTLPNHNGFYIQSDLYFPENPSIGLTTTEQIGYRYDTAHFVAGYHSGADLRLKHQLVLNSTSYFWYTGIRFEI